MKYVGLLAVVAIVGFGLWWFGTTPERGVVISPDGLHWHPRLEIFVKGEKQEIPANVGLGAVHNPVHTHEDLPVIHLEFEGRVTEDDIRLKRFFDAWGRDLESFGTLKRMEVNGELSSAYDAYVMHDSDIIKLFYE